MIILSVKLATLGANLANLGANLAIWAWWGLSVPVLHASGKSGCAARASPACHGQSSLPGPVQAARECKAI